MLEVRLDGTLAPGKVRRVVLRSVRGHDELIDATEPAAGRALIERLLLHGGSAGALTLSEHDRVLLALYGALFGDVVACRIRCAGCRHELGLELSLSELAAVETTETDRALLAGLRGPDADGAYSLGDGALRFRLPTCDDLADVAGLSPEAAERALEQRCVLAAAPSDREVLDRAMALVGPRVEAELGTRCDGCGHEQAVQFGIEDFLCAALMRERAFVLREVHVLARAYGWSRREILDMPQSDRRSHVRLVLTESRTAGGSRG